jgi:cold shock CspA family protein
MLSAICKSWDRDEGWGVLFCPDVPGELFAHFSYIEGDGYRELVPDEQVQIDWEPYPSGQDGYFYRAVRIVRSAA